MESWEARDKQLGREELRREIEEYIRQNNTCALATGAGSFVRCTPIEYAWHG